jgi:uncharacterized protein
MKKYIIPFIWVLLLAIATSGYALEVPKLTGYVNDYAGMLSKDEADRISRDLELYESTTSNQIFILTIPSLEGEDIEGFSIKVAESWKAGHKGKDNGVIITLAKADRKIRIEVGRGLEGTLTDLISGRIIDQEMSPRLKAGKTAEALETAIAKIRLAVKGEYKGDGKTAKDGEKEKEDSMLQFGLIIFFVITGIAGFANIFLGGSIGAVLGPALGYFMFNVTFPLLFIFIIGGFILGLAGRVVLEVGIAGGGGGGGGFGGGGGGFGGGGASGSW